MAEQPRLRPARAALVGLGRARRTPAPLAAHALAWLRESSAASARRGRPSRSTTCGCAGPRCPRARRPRSRAIVGGGDVRDDREARVLHAAGKGYPDLVRLRAGGPTAHPTPSCCPRRTTRSRAVLAACARPAWRSCRSAAARASSAASSRCAASFAAVISLDLGRLDGVARPRRALAAARVAGRASAAPSVERRARRERGFTLGHFPQSFEYVDVGGCVATRSAGQASTGYGRIDELVAALRCAAPGGRDRAAALPASAAGPDLRELSSAPRARSASSPRWRCACARAARQRATRAACSPRFGAGAEACARSSRAAWRPTSRACPTRTRRGCRSRSPGRGGRQGPASGARTCALRGVARRLPGDRRLGGRRRATSRARRARGAAVAAPPRRRRRSAARPGGRGRAGASTAPYLRDDLLAPRRAGRDARDRDAVVEPRTPAPRRRATRCGRARAARRSATSRTSIEPARRCTSRSSPASSGGEEIDQWRAAKARRVRRDRRGGRHDHPPPRGRRATTRPGWPREVGDAGLARAARGQGRARPRRDHEPREAAARASGLARRELQRRRARIDRAGLVGVWPRLAREDELVVVAGSTVGGSGRPDLDGRGDAPEVAEPSRVAWTAIRRARRRSPSSRRAPRQALRRCTSAIACAAVLR